MNTINDAKSTLTNALTQQAGRVADNAQKIAKVGTATEAPQRDIADRVQISAEARAAQEAGVVEANEAAATQPRRDVAPEAAIAEQNLESVLIDNKQAEIAYKAAAETLTVVNEMEGALLDKIQNREL